MASQVTYTYAQLEQLWIQNGGSKSTAAVAAAVAEAESNGRSWVTSANPDGGTNVGPWQLDTKGKGTGYTVAQLQDPNLNAAVAVKGSSNGTDWSAWETYTNGKYKAFISGSTTPDPNVPPAAAGAAAGTVTQATLDAATASASTCLIGFTSPSVLGIGGGTVCILSKAQMRALVGGGLLAAGGLLFIVGAVLVVGIGLGQSATAAKLAKVTPAGKLATLAGGGQLAAA